MIMACHLELRVKELERSIGFYQHLFDQPPQAVTPTYALFCAWNWELLLIPGAGQPIGWGLRVEATELDRWEQKFQQQGLALKRCSFEHGALKVREIALVLTDPDDHRFSVYALIPTDLP